MFLIVNPPFNCLDLANAPFNCHFLAFILWRKIVKYEKSLLFVSIFSPCNFIVRWLPNPSNPRPAASVWCIAKCKWSVQPYLPILKIEQFNFLWFHSYFSVVHPCFIINGHRGSQGFQFFSMSTSDILSSLALVFFDSFGFPCIPPPLIGDVLWCEVVGDGLGDSFCIGVFSSWVTTTTQVYVSKHWSNQWRNPRSFPFPKDSKFPAIQWQTKCSVLALGLEEDQWCRKTAEATRWIITAIHTFGSAGLAFDCVC